MVVFSEYRVRGRLVDMAVYQETMPRVLSKQKSSTLIYILTGTSSSRHGKNPGSGIPFGTPILKVSQTIFRIYLSCKISPFLGCLVGIKKNIKIEKTP